MHVVVAIQSQFTGQASAGLTAAIEATGEDDQIIAVLHRPVADGNEDDVDDEIDVLTDFLATTERKFRVLPVITGEDLSATLCQIAADPQVRLVVVEIAQQPPQGRNLLGSQAQRLILECPCSVLVARAS